MRGAGKPAADDADDLAELVHQPFLGVEPAGGIHEDRIEIPRDGRVDGVERDRGRVAAGRAGDTGHAQPLRPDLELIDGARAVRVGRDQQDLPALALKAAGQLGHRGGFAGAVHADHQDHRRARGASRQGSGILGAVEHGGQPALERLTQVGFGFQLSFADLVFQRLGELDRGGDPEVRLDQHPLHLLQVFGAQTPHQRAHIGEREALDPGPQPVVPILQSALGHAQS